MYGETFYIILKFIMYSFFREIKSFEQKLIENTLSVLNLFVHENLEPMLNYLDKVFIMTFIGPCEKWILPHMILPSLCGYILSQASVVIFSPKPVWLYSLPSQCGYETRLCGCIACLHFLFYGLSSQWAKQEEILRWGWARNPPPLGARSSI